MTYYKETCQEKEKFGNVNKRGKFNFGIISLSSIVYNISDKI